MARLALYGALFALMGVAPSLALLRDFTPVPSWYQPKRSLKQAQCTCYSPSFSCTVKSLFCPSGSVIIAPLETFNCTFPVDLSLPQNPCLGAPTSPQGPVTLTCPSHAAVTSTSYCIDGIPINGGSTAPCRVCQSLNLVGNCDINGLTPSMNKAFWAPGFGRASISCPTTSLTCTSVGQVITPADLGCTATSPAACATPTPIFWYNSHVPESFYFDAGATNTLPDKITCTPEMVAGTVTCLYRVGGLPCNNCLNKNGAVNVVVGTGRPPISVSRNPVGCATAAF